MSLRLFSLFGPPMEGAYPDLQVERTYAFPSELDRVRPCQAPVPAHRWESDSLLQRGYRVGGLVSDGRGAVMSQVCGELLWKQTVSKVIQVREILQRCRFGVIWRLCAVLVWLSCVARHRFFHLTQYKTQMNGWNQLQTYSQLLRWL